MPKMQRPQKHAIIYIAINMLQNQRLGKQPCASLVSLQNALLVSELQTHSTARTGTSLYFSFQKFETRMTASILKQDPNTKKR